MSLTHLTKLAAFGLAASALLASPAHAVYTLNITESGGNVVMSGSGSINTGGLTLQGQGDCSSSGPNGAVSMASPPYLCVGTSGVLDYYTAATGPASMGTGLADTPATSSSGSPFALATFTSNSWSVFVPTGYTSGTAINSSSTYNGTGIAALGLTPGTYTLTFGSGANTDSIVLNITAAQPVPTLGEYGILALASLLAMSGIAYARKRQG